MPGPHLVEGLTFDNRGSFKNALPKRHKASFIYEGSFGDRQGNIFEYDQIILNLSLMVNLPDLLHGFRSPDECTYMLRALTHPMLHDILTHNSPNSPLQKANTLILVDRLVELGYPRDNIVVMLTPFAACPSRLDDSGNNTALTELVCDILLGVKKYFFDTHKVIVSLPPDHCLTNGFYVQQAYSRVDATSKWRNRLTEPVSPTANDRFHKNSQYATLFLEKWSNNLCSFGCLEATAD